MRRLWVLLGIASLACAGFTSTSARADEPPGKSARPRLTKTPTLLKFVEAVYPESERAAHKTAQVVLTISIGKSGLVEDAVVAESAGPAFDEAAVVAAKQFVFEPAEIDGKPAAVKIQYRYQFVEKIEQKTTADLRGTVLDRTTKKPLAHVIVELDGTTSRTTGEDGRFSFDDQTPGKHAVTLRGEHLVTIQTEETLETGKRTEATYSVELRSDKPVAPGEEEDLEIVVVAPPLTKQVVSTEVAAEEARRVPGTQGDVLKVVENMPGVARAAVGSGALVVWGAAPQDTRVYVDGVRLPALYHYGGYRSLLSSELVKSVELAPGGYQAPYGGGLGGLVTVSWRPLDDRGFHGSVQSDVLDSSAAVRGGTETVHAEIAARKSYLGSVLSDVTSRDVGAFVPIPRYEDAQLRLGWDVTDHTRIEVGGLYSDDRVDHSLPSADPGQTKTESNHLGSSRLWFRYERQNADGSVISVVPSIGWDHSSLDNRFGNVPTSLAVDTTVYGFRGTWRGHVFEHVVVTAGVDVEATSSQAQRVGSITTPPREGDILVFGQAPSDQVNVDSWSTTIVGAAPFAEMDWSLFEDTLHVTPGARFEPYVVSASRKTPAKGDTPSIGATTEETEIEPRVSVRWSPSREFAARAAFGTYHQPPAPEDLSAVFGNPTLGPSHATHWLAGATVRPLEELTMEATGFYSKSEDLAIRSPSPAPLLAQALVQGGSGRAYGTQIMLRRERSGGFFGWLSYSLLRSERTDVPGGPYRLFDYDQTHVVTAVASYELGLGFEVGVRARAATGFPRTPVLRAYYDGRLDAYAPVFGAHNSIRIPAFYQLDARLAKRLKIGDSELEIYLDIQNVSDRKNPEEIIYSYDYKTQGYITGLPILPVVGARFTW